MHLSRQLAAKLSAALMAVATVIVPAMAADVGTVTSDTGLNLRAEANTNAAVLATVDYGTQVDVLSTSADGTWHKVTYNGMTGYMSGDYLQVTEEKLYGQVVEGPLNIRSSPRRLLCQLEAWRKWESSSDVIMSAPSFRTGRSAGPWCRWR